MDDDEIDSRIMLVLLDIMLRIVWLLLHLCHVMCKKFSYEYGTSMCQP